MHYRAIGRQRFCRSKSADRKLATVARSLTSCGRVAYQHNEAFDRFLAPRMTIRRTFATAPLEVDPDHAKRNLSAIDLSILEDPLLERLLSDKRRESIFN